MIVGATVLALAALLALVCWQRRQTRLLQTQARLREAELQAVLAQAREQATAVERERIYHDMHDDVGAKLMTLMHSARDPETADLARALHQDLRDVVSRAQSPPPSLRAALAAIREEAEQRLAGIRAELVWQQGEPLPDLQLDPAQSLHLFRIVREAVSNAIRHGRVQRLRVRVRASAARLLIDITDDGPGLGTAAAASRGMQGMRQRAGELQGSLHWDAGTQGGTKVILEFPLPAA